LSLLRLRLFAVTFHPPSSNGTLAHIGPPSRPLPSMRASKTRPGLPVTAVTCAVVMLVSGTFARRSQQESACPARTPEFT
jgi:hypothetical protein